MSAGKVDAGCLGGGAGREERGNWGMGAMRVGDVGSGMRESERATSWFCVGDKETARIHFFYTHFFHSAHPYCPYPIHVA